MNCKEAISLMHDYLDNDIQQREAYELNEHLQECSQCEHHFKQLENTNAIIGTLKQPPTPNGLTERVMQSIKGHKRPRSWLQWVKRYPAISVVAVFVFVMLGSFLTLWNQGSELMVKGDDLEHIVIEGDKVIIPEGQTVYGNLVVENGEIQVDGHITGNLIVIDGSVFTASTANISGKVTKINQAIDWLWYKTSELFSGITAE